MTLGPRHAWDREMQAERRRMAEDRRIRALAEHPETD